jgi:hypothetical protein
MMPDNEKDLVEIIEGEADELGLPKDPTVSLFGQPLKMLPGSPDAADIAIFVFFAASYSMKPVIDTPMQIRGYMESALHLRRCKPELSIKELRDGPYYAQFREPATNLFYTFAPDPALLVVVTGKNHGSWSTKASDYAFAVDIYTNEKSIPRGIARHFNSLYENGIVASTDWNQVHYVFGVPAGDCIETWQHLIKSTDMDEPGPAGRSILPQFCSKCGKQFDDDRPKYCPYCGLKRSG